MPQELSLALDNLMSPAALENPYPIYRQLRTIDPVRWNPIFKTWLLTRYADIAAVFQDPRFSSDWASGYTFGRLLTDAEQSYMNQITPYFSMFMQGMDAPAHTRQRALVNKAFTPRMLERIRTHIQQKVDDLLDQVQANRQIEVMNDLAYPLPSRVILELLGIPLEGRDYIQASSDTLAEFFSIIDPAPDQLKRMAHTLMEAGKYLKRLIAERRKYPEDNLLSAMVNAEECGNMLSEQELIIVCTLLLFSGHETTTNLIGNGLLALLRNPDQLEQLKAHPALIGPAVEELLRYDSPVQVVSRVPTEDIEIGGKVISKGQRVMLGLGSTNRDPEQFAEPDQLDIGRQTGRSLSFGYGIHFCLGAVLARMEGQITISTLLSRMPRLQLATDKVEWRPNFALRGLKTLPLTF